MKRLTQVCGESALPTPEGKAETRVLKITVNGFLLGKQNHCIFKFLHYLPRSSRVDSGQSSGMLCDPCACFRA